MILVTGATGNIGRELVGQLAQTGQPFSIMVRNTGKALPHRAILQHVWGPEYGEENEYLRVYVGRLRRKIEADPLHPAYLHTEHGIGYRFEA